MKNRLYFNQIDTPRADKRKLVDSIRGEKNSVGYYNLPLQNIDEIMEFAEE